MNTKPTLLNKKDNQQVFINDRKLNQRFRYPINKIKTSKYTLLDFLPKSLIQQFIKMSNFYFLCTAVVQSIEIISPLTPFTAIAPLCVVLTVSLIREAIEDLVNPLPLGITSPATPPARLTRSPLPVGAPRTWLVLKIYVFFLYFFEYFISSFFFFFKKREREFRFGPCVHGLKQGIWHVAWFLHRPESWHQLLAARSRP